MHNAQCVVIIRYRSDNSLKLLLACLHTVTQQARHDTRAPLRKMWRYTFMLLLEHGSKQPDSISFGKVESTNSNKQGEHKQGAKDRTQVDLSCIALGIRSSMVFV